MSHPKITILPGLQCLTPRPPHPPDLQCLTPRSPYSQSCSVSPQDHHTPSLVQRLTPRSPYSQSYTVSHPKTTKPPRLAVSYPKTTTPPRLAMSHPKITTFPVLQCLTPRSPHPPDLQCLTPRSPHSQSCCVSPQDHHTPCLAQCLTPRPTTTPPRLAVSYPKITISPVLQCSCLNVVRILYPLQFSLFLTDKYRNINFYLTHHDSQHFKLLIFRHFPVYISLIFKELTSKES